MSDDTEPSDGDNVIVANFGLGTGRPLSLDPAPSESQRMRITRVPGSDSELERALSARTYAAWLDVLDIIDIRLERPRERSDLVDVVLPFIEANLQDWPDDILRPASPKWLAPHDAGDPLAARLIRLTRAPGGYVLTRHFSRPNHEEPSNGSILHETPDELERDCAAFFDTVSLSVDLATCVFGVEFELCVLRWGVAEDPTIDVCELLGFDLGGQRVTLASARAQPDQTRAALEQLAPLDAPRDPHSSARPIELELAPLPDLATPRASARLSELAATAREEGSPIYRVLGVLEELHGRW